MIKSIIISLFYTYLTSDKRNNKGIFIKILFKYKRL